MNNKTENIFILIGLLWVSYSWIRIGEEPFAVMGILIIMGLIAIPITYLSFAIQKYIEKHLNNYERIYNQSNQN